MAGGGYSEGGPTCVGWTCPLQAAVLASAGPSAVRKTFSSRRPRFKIVIYYNDAQGKIVTKENFTIDDITERKRGMNAGNKNKNLGLAAEGLETANR